MRYTMDLHMMLTKPTPTHLFDAGKRMKICRFIDEYATRLYGTRTVSAWFTKNKGKTIFDLVMMSNIAYTVAVIENGRDKWGESKNGSDGDEESPKKPKFTQRGGIKGQYTTTGWSQEGIEFYNKVWEEWKKLSGSNKFGVWEKWRVSGLITWKRQGWGEIKEKRRSTSQTWNTKMWIILFQTCHV